MKKFLLAFALFSSCYANASSNDTIIFTTLGHYYFNVFSFNSVYSPLIDRLGRPYVYGPSPDIGLVTFNIANLMAPVPVDTIPLSQLNNGKANCCTQVGNDLFVGSGNLHVTGERACLTIFDMSTPTNPVMLDQWDSAAFTAGCSQIIVSGNYAYLAALDFGIIILNISDPSNIQFVSHLNMTNTACMNNNHARGIFLSHDTLLVANDCGGLRVVSVAVPAVPVQIGTYTNAPAYGTGIPYYNHVWRQGDHAYIPVDYCGFEIDNVANPAAVVNEGMWNPNMCTSGNWGGADVHGNEIISAYPAANAMLVSGGDSQVLAFDATSISTPRLMGAWGPPNDSVGSWGIDLYSGLVAVGTIKTPGPFYSEHGGLQLLNWALILGDKEEELNTQTLDLFPNPSSSTVTVAMPQTTDASFHVDVVDLMGNTVMQNNINANVIGRNFELDLSSLAAGVYMVRVSSAHAMCTGRVVKN